MICFSYISNYWTFNMSSDSHSTELLLKTGFSITHFTYTFIVIIFNYMWMHALHKERFIKVIYVILKVILRISKICCIYKVIIGPKKKHLYKKLVLCALLYQNTWLFFLEAITVIHNFGYLGKIRMFKSNMIQFFGFNICSVNPLPNRILR